jgi:hypothetical protein
MSHVDTVLSKSVSCLILYRSRYPLKNKGGEGRCCLSLPILALLTVQVPAYPPLISLLLTAGLARACGRTLLAGGLARDPAKQIYHEVLCLQEVAPCRRSPQPLRVYLSHVSYEKVPEALRV